MAEGEWVRAGIDVLLFVTLIVIHGGHVVPLIDIRMSAVSVGQLSIGLVVEGLTGMTLQVR